MAQGEKKILYHLPNFLKAFIKWVVAGNSYLLRAIS